MRLSFSGLERAEKCPPSVALPHVIDDRHFGYRERGVALHGYVETRDLTKVPEEYRDEARAMDLGALDRAGEWAREVAFAYRPEMDTARELGRSLERDYSGVEQGEVPGTADLVGLLPDAVVVLDLKTGNGPLPEPRKALQLQAIAVSAARAYGREKAWVGWLRLLGGELVWRLEPLDAWELELAATRIRDLVRAAALARVDDAPVLGPWCRYCPAFRRCPAQTQLLAAVAAQPSFLTDGFEPEMGPLLLERVEAVELAVKEARAILETHARAHPIRLPTGEVFGAVEHRRETLDAERAKEVLFSELPEAFETRVTVSKDSVREAVRARVKVAGGTIKKAMDFTLQRLRAAGAVKVSVYERVERFKPLPPGES